MNTPHTLLVCTTCASLWQDGKRVGESRGQQLLVQLQHLAQDWNLQNESFEIIWRQGLYGSRASVITYAVVVFV